MKSNFKIFPPTFEIVEEEPAICRTLSEVKRLNTVAALRVKGFGKQGLSRKYNCVVQVKHFHYRPWSKAGRFVHERVNQKLFTNVRRLAQTATKSL